MTNKNLSQSNSSLIFKTIRKNYYVIEALKLVLADVSIKPINYCIDMPNYFSNNSRVLKEISYILTISIKEFLEYMEKHEEQIFSIKDAKSHLEEIIKNNIFDVRYNREAQKKFYKNLDKNLQKSYLKYEVVSEDAIIQFIHWTVKNIPRLCINKKNKNLEYYTSKILTEYFETIFFAINEYAKVSKKMTSSKIRNFLSSIFIDKILETEYYQYIFK